MKNKILDNLPAIFVCLVFIFGMTLTWNHAKAEEKDMRDLLPGFWWEQIPAICVDDKSLWGYAQSKDLQPLNVSYGRVNGKEDGEVVYIVTYWVNVHDNQSMSSVKTPGSKYSCILFRTFDLQLNPGFDFNPRVDT